MKCNGIFLLLFCGILFGGPLGCRSRRSNRARVGFMDRRLLGMAEMSDVNVTVGRYSYRISFVSRLVCESGLPMHDASIRIELLSYSPTPYHQAPSPYIRHISAILTQAPVSPALPHIQLPSISPSSVE